MARRSILTLVWLAIGSSSALWACSLCPGSIDRATLREDANLSKLVLFGTLANPRIAANGNGATDLQIEAVVKSDAVLAGRKALTISRFVPVDPKAPPKFLVFCDIINGEIDVYRGTPFKTSGVVDYVKGAAQLPADRSKHLLYYFRFLDSEDAEIATDAYIEFAKTGDTDVARAAKDMDPARFRKLLADPATPPDRLSLFAYLLGASGGANDDRALLDLLGASDERSKRAFGGALAGLIQLKPKVGWDKARAILSDSKRPFGERLAALGAIRFFQASQPDAVRAEILQALAAVLPQNDLADLAIQDLRRWQWWDLTNDIIALFARPSHSAPIMKRAILRYALCCPQPAAREFVERIRLAEPDLVKDVEESLSFERPAKPDK
jgi:hypothetical protein